MPFVSFLFIVLKKSWRTELYTEKKNMNITATRKNVIKATIIQEFEFQLDKGDKLSTFKQGLGFLNNTIILCF